MSPRRVLCGLALALAAGGPAAARDEKPAPKSAPAPKTTAEVLAAAQPSDWRPLDPENTLYLELPSGRVVIELAPTFAPRHVANIKALAREGYFDGLAILRSQENYVVQWGDPDEENPRPVKNAKESLPPEFTRALDDKLPWTRLPDGDVYAPEVGFSNGFPAARDRRAKQAWLAHCYAMVGAARGDGADSGSGTSLYVVIGHAPRNLDRNITLVGRVVQGMELLSTLPRGPAPMGFYEQAAERTPVRAVRVAADVPEPERTNLELLRTDTPTFAAFVESRRNRREPWYKVPAGKVEICAISLPVRPAAAAAGTPR